MLVKFFKRGNTTNAQGEDVLNYLLSNTWAEDNEKIREGARLLRGNPYHTTKIINQSSHKKKYLSGCLSFHSDEKISEDLKQKLMDDFEHCLLPSLDPTQYSCYWVEHADKIDVNTNEKRLELNFVFATTELTKNKKLNVYYHYSDVKRIDLWQSITNFDHDLFDPKDPIRTAPATMSKNHSAPREHKSFKQAVHEFIEGRVRIGEIYDRQSLIAVLQKQGYELSRIAKTSISIKNPDGKNIRLKGEYYHENFTASKVVDIPRQKRSELWHQQRQHDMPKMRAEFEKLMKARETDLLKRHPFKNIYADYTTLIENPNKSQEIVEQAKKEDRIQQDSLSKVKEIVVGEETNANESSVTPVFSDYIEKQTALFAELTQEPKLVEIPVELRKPLIKPNLRDFQYPFNYYLTHPSPYFRKSNIPSKSNKNTDKDDDWRNRFGAFKSLIFVQIPNNLTNVETDNEQFYFARYRKTHSNWLFRLIDTVKQSVKRTTENVVRAVYDDYKDRSNSGAFSLIGAITEFDRGIKARGQSAERTGKDYRESADPDKYSGDDDIRFKFRDEYLETKSVSATRAFTNIDSDGKTAELLDFAKTMVEFETVMPVLSERIPYAHLLPSDNNASKVDTTITSDVEPNVVEDKPKQPVVLKPRRFKR